MTAIFTVFCFSFMFLTNIIKGNNALGVMFFSLCENLNILWLRFLALFRNLVKIINVAIKMQDYVLLAKMFKDFCINNFYCDGKR